MLDFTADVLRTGQGQQLLEAMVSAGVERVAAPLVAALDAAISGGTEKLESAEPELRAAALELHQRIVDALARVAESSAQSPTKAKP